MNTTIFFLFIFLVSGAAALLGTAVVRGLAVKKGYFDKPGGRKIHTKPVPTLGGIALWLGFNAGMAAAFVLLPGLKHDFLLPFAGISFAAFVNAFAGAYDDLHDLRPFLKLLVQLFSAVVLVSFGFEIRLLTGPGGGSLPLGVLSLFVSIVWIVGMINAVNLLDGLDGLAAGVCAIALSFLLIASLNMQMIHAAVISACLIGAICGFLPFNFHPAKIFMGNTGSMFLGVMLAVVSIAGFQKRAAAFTLFVPVLAMALPVMDTLLSIVRRLLKKQPVFKADREHIHHRLLKEEKSQAKAVLSLYFLTFCYGLIALGFSAMQGISAIIALIIIVLVTLKWLNRWGFLTFNKRNQ